MNLGYEFTRQCFLRLDFDIKTITISGYDAILKVCLTTRPFVENKKQSQFLAKVID